MRIRDWSSDVCSSDLQKDSVVTQVQKELKERGYYDGSIDGKNSAKTRAAAMRFQADAGLSVSGTVNEELLKALQTADKAVRRNSTRSFVSHETGEHRRLELAAILATDNLS